MQGEQPTWFRTKRDWSERELLLALACTRGRLPARIAAKLAAGQSPAALLTPGSPDPRSAAEVLERLCAHFLVSTDEHWPLPSGEPDPPCAWLFLRGRVPPVTSGSVAVVGSRRASSVRQQLARTFGGELAAAGWHVVSGAALGIDGWAHRGSLEVRGGPGGVAVLGCGPDVAYPSEHAELLERLLAAGGGIVTEHGPGTPPLRSHFLARNRLIAALARAVVVVGAGARSGSLATARMAAERGCGTVLVVPGSPWEEGAAGCNALIRDGALLVTTTADVLEVIGKGSGPASCLSRARMLPAPAVTKEPSALQSSTARAETPALGALARRIAQVLAAHGPQSGAVLAQRLGAAAPALTRALVELELAGWVRRIGSLVEVVDQSPGRW